jgi:hypothetical protein
MPPRRRQGKRRAPLTGEDGLLFLFDDGVHPLIDRGPGDPPYTVFEAPAVWERVRVQVWRNELRDLWPPMGAVVYDGICDATQRFRPHAPFVANEFTDSRYGAVPGTEVIWSVDQVRRAVDEDVASVEAFRRAKASAAAEITDELNVYLEDLNVLLAIAETGLEGATSAWSHYEQRRQYDTQRGAL